MIIEIPECMMCKKTDKVISKTIWFEHKKKKQYLIIWICERCDYIIGDFFSG